MKRNSDTETHGHYKAWLHGFSVVLCVSTFILIFAGGLVTSTDSGLSVPDWPNTYNYNMFTFPVSMWVGGIFYEHGHRLIASGVGLITMVLCAMLWFGDRRAWVRYAGLVAFLLVVTQGVLGGLTVLYKLPAPISVAHGATAQLFFLLTGWLAFATSRTWFGAGAIRPWGHNEKLALVLVSTIFLQAVMGAVIRHTYNGMAIPTFPLAFGAIIPPAWNFGVTMHFIHSRLLPTMIVFLALWLLVKLRPRSSGDRFILLSSVGLAGLLAIQVLLGVFTIWSGREPWMTTFHVAGGALLLLQAFLLFLGLVKLDSKKVLA